MTSPILSVDQARALDLRAKKEFGIEPLTLMENAGDQLAEICDVVSKNLIHPMFLIFCGVGNNGGDGLVAARRLSKMGKKVQIVLCGDLAKLSEEARHNYRIISKLNIPVVSLDDFEWKNNADSNALVVVDALMGTGFKPPLRRGLEKAIGLINDRRRERPNETRVVSADIPSGLNGDTGPAGTQVVKADVTVTFAAMKKGLLIPESAPFVGEVKVVDIGIPKALVEQL